VPISWKGSNPALRFFDKLSLTMLRKLINWVQAILHLRHYDFLIVPGTSTLCDYRANPFGAPYALLRWAAAAWLCGTKLCFISTGAGPIRRRLSRWMLIFAARSAHYRSFRDIVSKEFLASAGVDTSRDAIYPDLAFRLPTPAPFKPSLPRPVTVGIGLMDYNGWHGHAGSDVSIYTAYVEKIARFARSILDRGFRVRLLGGEIADLRAVTDIRARLDEIRRSAGEPQDADEQVVAEPVSSLHELMLQMREADVVIAARYHNVICAMKLCRPTIALAYEAKHEALMRDMGLGEFCHHIEHFDTSMLERQAMELLANASAYEERISRKLTEIDRLAMQQERVLMETLASPA
jgi:polysaccharide pyruvyl transferase WcaK-like protein